MARKGQFGLDSLFSYIVFGTFLLFTLMLLSISGCGREKVERGLKADAGIILELRASEQLSAYLRTEMPGKEGLIEKARSLYDSGKEDLREGIDIDNAINFIELHPEVYVGKTYAGFISSLYSYKDGSEKGKLQDAFAAVTRAVFYMKVREIRPGLGETYFFPVIKVKFDGGSVNLDSATHVLIAGEPGIAAKILPSYGRETMTVQLMLGKEGASLPTP